MGENVSVMGLLEQSIAAIDLGTQNTLEEWDLQKGHFEQKTEHIFVNRTVLEMAIVTM